MLAMLIWRFVSTFFLVNTVWGQDYQHPSEEYIYQQQQQPLQHYGGYEIHRQYRSAGDEPTTITPTVILKENLSENFTSLDSVVNSNSTHTNGSITLVTDVPVENTSVSSAVPSLLMGRDISTPLLELSNLASMEQQNITMERINSTLNNSTAEEIKILKKRQAQQVLIQQVPVQPQQVPLSVFQPLPVQRSQFIQAPPTLLFPGQPGQPALVQVPFGQSQFVPNQLRFVQPQLLVPQQVVPLQNSQVSITQPPVQSLKSPPKLSLNPVPLPPSISNPHPNMTIPASVNGSQVNAVNTREANANRALPKGQPLMGAFKPMASSMPTRPTPTLAPVRAAPMVPTTITPSLQHPGMMQMPVQPMVRPQLQGQQAPPPPPPPQTLPAVVLQTSTPLPHGLMVRPPSLEAQGGQPPVAVQPGSFSASTTHQLPPQIGQRSGSPVDLQTQQKQQPQQQPQLIGQAIPSQVAQRSGPPMDQPKQSLPVGQLMNELPSAAQHSVPLSTPSQPQPMIQTPAIQVAQPHGPRSMGQVQQQSMVEPVGQAPQAQAAQRSGQPVDQQLQQQPLPTVQAPPAQVAERSGSPMDQPQLMHPGQSMNQALDAQRSGLPVNHPSQPQPLSQPLSQTQVVQRPGPQLMGQPVGQAPQAQAVQRAGSVVDQLLQQQPMPVGQAPPAQAAQRSGTPMEQSQPMPSRQSMNQPPPDAQRSGPPVNQPSQPQPMGQPMGQASPAQVAQRSGPMLINQPLPTTSQQLGQLLGSPNNLPPPPPPPPQPQQLGQQMGFNQQPPQPPQIAPRTNPPMNQPATSQTMDFASPQSVDGSSLPLSQFNQRSVQDGRGGQDRGVPSNKERHLMRRSMDGHRMRRQMDAVPYPSKEAYDSYVVNNYRNQYDEVYPTYTPPVYTTTASAPQLDYYVSRY